MEKRWRGEQKRRGDKREEAFVQGLAMKLQGGDGQRVGGNRIHQGDTGKLGEGRFRRGAGRNAGGWLRGGVGRGEKGGGD